jgi:MFS family permease
MTNSFKAPANSSLPSRAYAWYTVALLTLVYVMSFVDRYILGLLVEPIKADMALTDTQIGLLLGPAFALFYTTMGIPLGWLADRTRRTLIVGVGAALWSLATMACGLAKNFVQLFIGRVAVGVGEAALSPCALSMIGDSFEPHKRGRPVAFYSAALSLGAGIASLLGASVIVWTKSVDVLQVPLVGEVAPWQFAFLAVGVIGLPLALLLFTLREPARQERAGLTGDDQAAGLKQAFSYLRDNRRAYFGFVPLVCVMTTVAYSQGWLPAMFERTWGWPPERYALYSGIGLLAVGPLTVNFAGWWSDRLSAQGVADAPARILVTGSLILIPTGCLAPLMPTAWLAFGVLMINLIGIAMVSAVAPTALLNITPGEIRGQIIAVYFLLISLTGLVLGPMTVGLLNDFVLGEAGVRYSVALVPLIYGLPVLLLARGPLRAYREMVNKSDY